MENKKVGALIIGIGVAVSIIILIFNYTLKNIVKDTCSHGLECTMHSSVNAQLFLSLAIGLIIFAVGFYVMYSKPEEKIVVKRIIEKPKKKALDLSGLDSIEKKAIKLIQEEGNAMFQKDLMEKLEIGKVKMTRLVDKLEAKDLVIRKRRGMNNIVVLKE
jgi:uncharacterized membrane protein